MNRRRFLHVVSASLFAALGWPLLAGAATWQVDPAHSRVGFRVRHMMISHVNGTFGDVQGTVRYDPAAPHASTVEVAVQVASIDTGVDKRDAHLRSPDFFDVETFPTMTFRSTRVTPAGDGRLEVRGELTLRGVSREIVLQVQGPSPEVTDPWGNTRIGASATATLNRKDFGLTWNKALEAGGVLVGDEVTIELDVELIKQGETEARK
ncbi:MAG: YceI family protein [Deferrisomatales bacterium]